MSTYYAYQTNNSDQLSTISGTYSYSGTITDLNGDQNTLGGTDNDQFSVNGQQFSYLGVTTVEVQPDNYIDGFIAVNPGTGDLFVFLPSFTGPIQETSVNFSSGEWNHATDTIVCLLEGTLVRMHDGERRVEDLRAGDLVVTADGAAVPIRWIGHTRVSRYQPDQLSILPIRIRAGALGENLPTRDLLVSPDHAVFIDGTLVQAGALVNGCSVVREWNAPKSFTYYHVELEAHALILAEGAPVETFVDNVDRMTFDNWEEHLQQFGEVETIPEMDYPRAKSARQVPSHVRRIIDRERRKFAVEVAA